MMTLKNITIKNFMSVGNVSQGINLNEEPLVLVLGNNKDLGGNGNRNGVGKAQPIYSKIKTPSGWTTMGKLNIGDLIRAPDGSATHVKSIHPQGVIDIYKFTFKDGRSTEACENHLWDVFINNEKQKRTISTKDIIPLLNTTKVSIPTIDPEIDHDVLYDLRNTIKNISTLNEDGSITVSTSDVKLLLTIQEMVWSIGGVASMVDNTLIVEYHYPSILVPNSSGKVCHYKKPLLDLLSIEYSGKHESQCITVEHKDQLYITDNYIVTHNSTIINAITYSLYGEALTKIKMDNLINKTNGKGMVVTMQFEKDGILYNIERGRKPNIFNFYKDGEEPQDNEAQGDSRLTQADLEKLIGMNKTMFSNIVALHTFGDPFLSMKTAEQREMIELLLGITKLSEKAEVLKEIIKSTKDQMKEEEFRINGIANSNKIIQQNIENTKLKKTQWVTKHETTIETLTDTLSKLCDIDIDGEINAHKRLSEIKDIVAKNVLAERTAQNKISTIEKDHRELKAALSRVVTTLSKMTLCVCPTCEQTINEQKHNAMLSEYNAQKSEIEMALAEIETQLTQAKNELKGMDLTTPSKPNTFYKTIDEAYQHKSKVDKMAQELENEMGKINPYSEQEDMLGTSLQEIDYTKMNDLQYLQNHHDFLLKLLTNKDSFIRKRIIEQNLSYLNERLRHYLEQIGLPHEVVFHPTLDVSITEYGRDLDFDNLSRGEKTRLSLSLSWAFRDIYETMNGSINLLFIDELLDSGLDSCGTESALHVLGLMAREHHKNVFLISHKEELVGRVDSILNVYKENGFTAFYASDR